MQIATGCPSQLSIPVKLKCQTTSNQCYMTTPLFGHCLNAVVDDVYVQQTIKIQEKVLTNQNHFLNNFKRKGVCSLLNDKYFDLILKRMISLKNYTRPNISEIANCKFIRNADNAGSIFKFKPNKSTNFKKLQSMINEF